MSKEIVELHTAFMWDCPTCGIENFARAIRPEMSEDDEMELRDRFGIDSWEEGDFLQAPVKVQCCHCDNWFDSKDDQLDDDDDDFDMNYFN